MLFMTRVLQGVAEFKVTGYATHIFGWTGPFAFKAGQLRSQFGVEIAAFLNNKFVLPAVTEIIQNQAVEFSADKIVRSFLHPIF